MYFLDGDAVETDQAPTYTNIAMYKSYLWLQPILLKCVPQT